MTDVGAEMMKGLEDLSVNNPGIVSNVRGRGTFCAVDIDTGSD